MPLSKSRHISNRGIVQSAGLQAFHPAFRHLWMVHIQGALRRGLANEISPRQLKQLIEGDCAYCGRPPCNETKLKGTQNIRYNGVDRLNNTQGYVIENLVPCCKECNSMKGELSYKAFIAHIQRIASHTTIRAAEENDPDTPCFP